MLIVSEKVNIIQQQKKKKRRKIKKLKEVVNTYFHCIGFNNITSNKY